MAGIKVGEISKTGLWVDGDGNVVAVEPAEGRQIVAPGTAVSELAFAIHASVTQPPKEVATLTTVKETADQPAGKSRK